MTELALVLLGLSALGFGHLAWDVLRMCENAVEAVFGLAMSAASAILVLVMISALSS